MASSTLIVYEPLNSFTEKPGYWEEYVKYYEKYWGGPTSPFGMWFGNEYSAFRDAIAAHLGVDKEQVDECLFMKDENGDYFIAPISGSNNIFSSENVVPLEWFTLVSEDERKNFYSHWGFNSIHYDSKLSESMERLLNARDMLQKGLDHDNASRGTLKPFTESLIKALDGLYSWLSGFQMSSFLILNYGDICSHIQPYTLKNENSVFDIKNILGLISSGNTREAELKLKIFFQKWDDIREKCTGAAGSTTIQ